MKKYEYTSLNMGTSRGNVSLYSTDTDLVKLIADTVLRSYPKLWYETTEFQDEIYFVEFRPHKDEDMIRFWVLKQLLAKGWEPFARDRATLALRLEKTD